FTLMSPAKIWPIATTPLLSVWGKARLAGEMLVRKKKTAEDESLESFVVRRFGREAFDRLVQPLIGGIYTADPAKLSMQATMPQFIQLEEQFGSLIYGMRTQQSQKKKNTGSGARYGMFLAPKSGMGRIAEAIVNKLPAGTIRTSTAVTHLAEDKIHGGWLVTCEGENKPTHYDAVVMAVPGPVMTRLLSPALPKLGSLFEKCEHAGCSVAVMGVRKDQLKHPLNGFGFVVPAIERRKILAGSFSSIKFDGRAPHDSVLIRVFVGGALQPHLGKLPDEEIRKIVMGELRSLLGMTGEPQFFDVVRWMNAMPQYHVGHLERVAAIEKLAAELPSMGLAGNTLHGVGVPFCIHAGEQAAEKVAKHLQGN
ncbi:MAG: protoporphyrinogen oxidase, partial [Pirellulales bacterium]